MSESFSEEKLGVVNIRPASEADLPVIEKILRDTIQSPYGSGKVTDEDEAEIQMELGRIDKALESSEDGSVLMAENIGGEGLGFAYFGEPDPVLLDYTHSNSESTLELKLLYLNPSQRNQGVGTQLIGTVEQVAKNSGKTRVELTSGPRYFFIGTRQFYLKRGYRQLEGMIPNYFDGKYPARVFQKDLLSVDYGGEGGGGH